MDDSKKQPEGWQQVFSKTHQRHYWFNTIDGSTSWLDPGGTEVDSTAAAAVVKKRAIEESTSETSGKRVSVAVDSPDTEKAPPFIAVIVYRPFITFHLNNRL